MEGWDGERIRKEREARRWSRQRLASAAGISQDGLRKIESGEVEPRPRTVDAIVRALLGDSQTAPEAQRLARFLRAWPRLPEGGQESLTELAEMAAGFAGRNELVPAGA